MSNLGSKSAAVKSAFIIGPCLQAQCIIATGDAIAGYLLTRIVYWNGRKAFERDGHKWIVLTRDQWLANTALTRHQYNRALALLKERKLVVVEYKKLRRRDRHLQTFIRLPDDFSVSAAPDSEDDASVSGLADSDPPSVSALPDSDTGTVSAGPDTTKNNTDNQGQQGQPNNGEAAAAQTAHPGKGFSEEGQEGGKTGKQAVPGSSGSPAALPVIGDSATKEDAAPVIAQFAASLVTDYQRRDMVHAWKSALHVRGEPVSEPIGGDRGKLASLAKAWGAYDPAVVLFTSMVRWDALVDYVQDHGEKQTEKWPPFGMTADPTIAALMHHQHMALAFAVKALAPPPPPAPPVKFTMKFNSSDDPAPPAKFTMKLWMGDGPSPAESFKPTYSD